MRVYIVWQCGDELDDERYIDRIFLSKRKAIQYVKDNYNCLISDYKVEK